MDNFNKKQESFGTKLAECRRSKNFTQEELANRLGVTPQALSKWEKGLSSPDIAIVCAICEMLDVSADYLLGIREGTITEDGSAQIWDRIWSNLRDGMDPLKLLIGEEIIPVFLGNHFVEKADELRLKLSREGILMPLVRIMDHQRVKPREFFILAYENVLYSEELQEINEATLNHIMEKLGQMVREKYAEIISVDIIKSLTDNLRIRYPALIEGVIPNKISYGLLLDVVKGFLNRGNGMVYLPKIIEAMERRLREQPESTTAELLESACTLLDREDNFWIITGK